MYKNYFVTIICKMHTYISFKFTYERKLMKIIKNKHTHKLTHAEHCTPAFIETNIDSKPFGDHWKYRPP